MSDGSSYIGEYKNGSKEGNGCLTLQNKAKYYGSFIDNKIEGKGTCIWSEKKYYQGEWKNFSFEGIGIYFQEKTVHKGNLIKLI